MAILFEPKIGTKDEEEDEREELADLYLFYSNSFAGTTIST